MGDHFHAITDKQEVRDAVFEEVSKHPFKVHTTICEKAEAQLDLTKSRAVFYKYPWFYTLKHGLSQQINEGDEPLITAASLGTKKVRKTYCNVLDGVMGQTIKSGNWAVDFRPSSYDSCLKLADYCAWAIQRKWERGDVRSYDLIKHKITRARDLWSHGAKSYY